LSPPDARAAGQNETIDDILASARSAIQRLTKTERVIAGATFVVFIALFLPWYSISLGSTDFTVSAIDTGSGGFRVLILILSILILLYYGLRAGGVLKHGQAATETAVQLGATGVNALLVVIAFFVKPAGNWDWAFGAFVALIAAVGAFVAALRGRGGFLRTEA
jgi:hypothetical protein